MRIVSADQRKDSAAAQETVAICVRAEKARLHACTKLETTLRQMVNDPAFSDVAFLCNDGKQVQGCKILLAGTSEVLKSMFMNGMAESYLHEIELPEMSSPVLLSVFEFLYTGTLRDYYPQSWKIACELINASGFFLLPELDMIVREFMHSQILSVAEDLPKAATLLTEALEFKALCDPMDVSLRALVKILGSDWSASTFIKSLSEDAFHYFLANSKGKSEDLDVLSFGEYLRFRQVIWWWVYQCDIGSCGTEELVNFLAPDLERAVTICQSTGNLEVVENPQEDIPSLSEGRNSMQLDEVSRNAASRLLSNIDYRCIYPVILAKVVEPLKISSPEMILNAYRYQAIRRPMIFKTLKWKHDRSYRTSEQGSVIHTAREGMGNFAVLHAPMSTGPYSLFQWRIIIEESPETIQLGFRNGKSLYYFIWPGTECGGVPKSEGREDDILIGCPTDLRVYRFPVESSIGANVRFLFSFNAFERTCSFSINDQHHKYIWKNLPSGTYRPALNFLLSRKRRARIELVSGFDNLFTFPTGRSKMPSSC